MKLSVNKRTLITSVISILVVSIISIGGYYYVTNVVPEPEAETSSPLSHPDKVFLESYSETGFLVESPLDGEFWRFEIVRPVFESFMEDNGKNYIKGYIVDKDRKKVPIGVYSGGDIEGLAEKYSVYTEKTWVRPEYNNEDLSAPAELGRAWPYKELIKEWDVKPGDQFEVFILASGPDPKALENVCDDIQNLDYCMQSFVNQGNLWNVSDVYSEGAHYPLSEPGFVEIFPYFIGRIIE